MQCSYRWQPHLPFFPVTLPFESWAERYNYNFHSLPIVRASPTSWTLDIKVADHWSSQVRVFSQVLRELRGSLAMAPMSVDYVPDIREHDIYRPFESEEKARRACWYYRTLVFCMFAEFAYVAAGRKNWREKLIALNLEKCLGLNEGWIDEVDNILCDFRYTKRAGVIIDISSHHLLPTTLRYHKNGVPVLMEFGRVLFHDAEENPQLPSFLTSDVLNDRDYTMQSDWPNRSVLIERTKQLLLKSYPHRLGSSEVPRRPVVEELGGNVHKRPATTPWINPSTHEPADYINVSEPTPANPRRSAEHIKWIEFLDRRREVNRKRELNETPVEKQRRESRLRDSIKINQIHSSLPSKKSKVYQWVEEDSQVGECTMHEYMGPIWRRVLLTRGEVEGIWDDYLPTQRIYDSFTNQWDLHTLFDYDARPPNHDMEDDEDDDLGDATHIDQVHMAYLDQLKAPAEDAYSGVQLLSSQISFIAPKNLESWAYLALGLKRSTPLDPPFFFPQTSHVVGYLLDEFQKGSEFFQFLQEFVSYIVNRDFRNPRLATLSDLNPQNPSLLNITTAGVYINRVKVSKSGEFGSSWRVGYILTPKHQDSSYNYGWILLIFEAISVIQIIRNSWCSSSMEDLVRHLIRHGIQFRTLVPATKVIPDDILKLNQAPDDFTLIPPLDPKLPLTSADYMRYLEIREKIIKSPHGRAAFRMGGILWRLAMESTENFDDVVSEIMEGPCELGHTRGEYLFVEGLRYYDLVVIPSVADTICGIHGLETGRNKSPGCKCNLLYLWVMY